MTLNVASLALPMIPVPTFKVALMLAARCAPADITRLPALTVRVLIDPLPSKLAPPPVAEMFPLIVQVRAAVTGRYASVPAVMLRFALVGLLLKKTEYVVPG